MSQRSTTVPASTLGADILLARHGDFIVTWRTDRKHDLTLARLADGSWDCAPNHLDAAPVKQGRPVQLGEAPAQKAAGWFKRYKNDELAMKRSEVRWLGKVLGTWTLVATAISGGLVWAAVTFGDPATMEAMMTGPGF